VVEFREGCSITVGAAGGNWLYKLCDWSLGGRAVACLLAHGRPVALRALRAWTGL